MSDVTSVLATSNAINVKISVGVRPDYLSVLLSRDIESRQLDRLSMSAPSTQGDQVWYRDYASGLLLMCDVADRLETARQQCEECMTMRQLTRLPDYVLAAFVTIRGHEFMYERGRFPSKEEREYGMIDLTDLQRLANDILVVDAGG